MDILHLSLYILFGVLPSLVWLSYYLRKDKHPESAIMVIKVFLWGAAITLPVFLVQLGLQTLLAQAKIPAILVSILYWFIVISFIEEFFKYIVVRAKIFNSMHLDEPLDIMLYMIIAALGFAALENVLYLFPSARNLSFNQILNNTLIISFIRFVGATFLHTLCSGVIGYFLALSFYNIKNRIWLFLSGIILATFLHGLYDFSIMTFRGLLQISIPVIILIGLAFFVMWGFNKTKRMKSVGRVEKLEKLLA